MSSVLSTTSPAVLPRTSDLPPAGGADHHHALRDGWSSASLSEKLQNYFQSPLFRVQAAAFCGATLGWWWKRR